MSNANQETIADIVAAMRNEGHAGNASCLEWVSAKFTSYADRIEAAHQREVAELKRQRNEALAIASDIDKCASIERHTDAMLKKNEVIVGLRKEVAELRECLKEAVTEVCNRLEKCGFKEPCVFKTCYVQKWRKALKGSSND